MQTCEETPVNEGTDVKIDRGVPVPPPAQRPIRHVYPLRKLSVGDSFFLPCEAGDTRMLRNRVHSSCGQMRRRNVLPRGFALQIRSTSEKGQIGVRVWRVA